MDRSILTLDTETNGEGKPGLVAIVEYLGFRAEIIGPATKRTDIVLLADDAMDVIEMLARPASRNFARAAAVQMGEIANNGEIGLYFGTPRHCNDWDEINWFEVQPYSATDDERHGGAA